MVIVIVVVTKSSVLDRRWRNRHTGTRNEEVLSLKGLVTMEVGPSNTPNLLFKYVVDPVTKQLSLTKMSNRVDYSVIEES